MIYFIFAFGLVIIGTIAFLIPVIKLILKEMVALNFWHHRMPIPVVEQRYDIEEVQSTIAYSDLEEMIRMNIHRPFDYFSTERIIRDQHHKQGIIEKECEIIARKLLARGLIRIQERENDFSEPPYIKMLRLTIKALRIQN